MGSKTSGYHAGVKAQALKIRSELSSKYDGIWTYEPGLMIECMLQQGMDQNDIEREVVEALFVGKTR